MAERNTLSAALRKISRHHLECIICQERYRQPKLLGCGHSFCQECLQKYSDGQYKGAPRIPCPMCRRQTALPPTGIPGLTANFHLIGMLEEVATLEKVARSDIEKLLCEACDEGNEAKHRCLDCAQNICLKCQKTHLQFRGLLSHTVVTLDEILRGKVAIKRQDEPKCHKHKGQAIQFYCVTCNVLICQACTALDHSKPEHHFMDFQEAAEKFKQSLNSKLPDFNRDVEGLKTTLKETSNAKRVFRDEIVIARKAVKDRAAQLIAKVKAEETQLLNEIDSTERSRNKRLDEHGKIVASLLQRKQHTLETAKDATTKTTACDFLSLYPGIHKDFEMMTSQQPPKISGMLQYPKVLQQTVCDINLGKLVVEDVWELCREFGKQGSGPGEFESARGIAASQLEEIAVADGINKRVDIYNNQGQIMSSIPVVSNDIAAIPNRWVVANPGIVKVYNKDNTLTSELTTAPVSEGGKSAVQLVSVAVKKNGNIIVGDIKRKVLTEHNPTDGSLRRTMPVEISPDYLAVISNERIAVSSIDQGQVDIVDGNAATIFSIKPTIKGQPVKSCRGTCCNSSGIYVAVSEDVEYSGHIHHYDNCGTFLGCIIQGLYNPLGITFTADGQQLAVADRHSVKIYHKV